MRYVTFSRVRAVEERFFQRWISGVGAEAIFKQESQGWFVWYEGSYEAIFLGKEPPELKVGDQVKITFQKVEQ